MKGSTLLPQRVVLVSLAVTLLPLSLASGQARNGWWPRLVRLNNPPAADLAIMEHSLRVAEQLMARTSGYATPRGFEARIQWASSAPRSDAPAPRGGVHSQLRTYWVEIDPYVPSREATAGNYVASAWIRFNPEFGFLAEGAMTAENGDVYFLERQRSERRYGATFVYGNFGEFNNSLAVLFTAGDRNPWIPVTREEFVRAQMHGVSQETKGLKTGQRATTKNAYQQWLDGAAQRKAEREAAMAQLRGILPAAEIEKMRQTQEATERAVTENLRQREPEDIENIRSLKALDPLAPFREQLASMSPEERASQAWAGGVQLMPAGAPGARRVVRVDPFFLFTSTGSNAEARAILVHVNGAARGLEHAQTQLYRELDWAALRALLDR